MRKLSLPRWGARRITLVAGLMIFALPLQAQEQRKKFPAEFFYIGLPVLLSYSYSTAEWGKGVHGPGYLGLASSATFGLVKLTDWARGDSGDKKEAAALIQARPESVRVAMARGHGESLEALAGALGCTANQYPGFARAVQAAYPRLSATLDASREATPTPGATPIAPGAVPIAAPDASPLLNALEVLTAPPHLTTCG